MNEKDLTLNTMRKTGVPLKADHIAELSGLDRQIVDKAMAAMKKR